MLEVYEGYQDEDGSVDCEEEKSWGGASFSPEEGECRSGEDFDDDGA
jgi:hypothetical protein